MFAPSTAMDTRVTSDDDEDVRLHLLGDAETASVRALLKRATLSGVWLTTTSSAFLFLETR